MVVMVRGMGQWTGHSAYGMLEAFRSREGTGFQSTKNGAADAWTGGGLEASISGGFGCALSAMMADECEEDEAVRAR
jgi:hypothetical protein